MIKSAIAFGLCSTLALAGTVHFDPPSATITPGTQNVSFEVSVSWETLATADTVNAIIVAVDGVELDFDLAQSFINTTTVPPPEPGPQTVYCGHHGCVPPHVGLGGNNFSANGWTSPLLVGTLTVDTSELMTEDIIQIVVDPDTEPDYFGTSVSLIGSGVHQEVISGSTSIRVVPEPATVSVLLAGLMVTIYRRGRVRSPLPHGRGTVCLRRCI